MNAHQQQRPQSNSSLVLPPPLLHATEGSAPAELDVSGDSGGLALDLPHTYSLAGWLDRRTGTGIGKRWKKRYFVIEPFALVEYRSLDGSSSKVFNLKDIDEILTEDREKFTFGFKYGPARWVTLRANNGDELDDWVSSLRKAVISPPLTPGVNARSPNGDLLAKRAKEPMPKLSNIVTDAPKVRAQSESAIEAARVSIDPRRTAPREGEPIANSDSLEAHSNSDHGGETTSDSEDDDDDIKPRTTKWGSTLKAFFSSSSRGTGLEERSDEDPEVSEPANPRSDSLVGGEAGGSEVAAVLAPAHELRTVQVIEYDLVEVFENQRWIPLGGWGVMMLPHDRAHWTNRTGHSRADWYRQSLEGDGRGTANLASSGQEDREEIPGAQIHVIKDPWQWEGPWRLSPLPALNPTVANSASQGPLLTNGKGDSFREGLRRDLRTTSVESVGDSEETADAHFQLQQMGSSTGATNNGGGGNGNGAAVSPTASHSAKQNTSTARASGVVRSLRKRLGVNANSSSRTSDSSGAPTAAGPGGGALAVIPNSEGSLPDAPPMASNGGDGWAHGFDFPEFDHALARGVPRHHMAANNVRTRRWVRLRRRVVNITGRLPPEPSALAKVVPAVISFQRQVVAEGWLGVRGRAGQWRSKYYKLIRTCDGVWDAGQGHGLVSKAPSSYFLVAAECKELHPSATKMIRIESVSLARANPVLNDAAYARSQTHASLISATTRFAVSQGSESRSVVAAIRERADDPPRAARFEVSVNKDHVFLFNADTREDALAWVSAINRAASELLEAQQLALQQQGEGGAVAAASPTHHGASGRHGAGRRGGGGLFFSILKKGRPNRAQEDLEDEDAEKEGALEVHLEDTGEEPVAAPEVNGAPPPMTTELDSKLREYIDLTLAVSLRTFFQTFVGDKARFSIADFHNEVGDEAVKCSLWSEPPPGGRQGRDDFDLEGFDVVPERLLTFRTPTGAPIGPSTTRVEKRQRYFYYPTARMLVLKTWAKSLDVPSGDAFVVMEKWIVTAPDKDEEHKVRVRVLSGAHFFRSVMIKGIIQKSVESGGYKIYDIWRKKFSQYAGGKRKAGATTGEDEGQGTTGDVASGEGRSLFARMSEAGSAVGPILGSGVRFAGLVFAVWYLLQLLTTLQRIADALERSHNIRPDAALNDRA